MAIKKMTTQEVRDRLSNSEQAVDMHREAVNNGLNFSRYLEAVDPSPKDSELDAFERQLQLRGIVTVSDPSRGMWASECDAFGNDSLGRALFHEFYARTWRSVAFANPTNRRAIEAQARAIITSGDFLIGSQGLPWAEAGPFWDNQFAPAIPLAEIVARTSAITGQDYRSLFVEYDAEALRLYRVGESAEIPMAKLTTSSRSIQLKKYGRGLRFTYEQIRRVRVDTIAWWVRWQALQAEVDKVAAAMDILVSGDGNANTAAQEYNMQADLNADATLNELDLKSWLAFRLKWANPYFMTTALMTEATALQLIMLNSGSGNVPLVNLQLAGVGFGLTPINTTADAIRYGWTSEAPSGKIVAFDKRFALEQITEVGSEISETERYITNQTQVVTMTENSAFAVIDSSATKILDLAQ